MHCLGISGLLLPSLGISRLLLHNGLIELGSDEMTVVYPYDYNGYLGLPNLHVVFCRLAASLATSMAPSWKTVPICWPQLRS